MGEIGIVKRTVNLFEALLARRSFKAAINGCLADQARGGFGPRFFLVAHRSETGRRHKAGRMASVSTNARFRAIFELQEYQPRLIDSLPS
jgi:hypothetical protein